MELLQLFLIVAVLLALCFAGMGIRIWIKGTFAETEVGHNKHMRERGISCAKDEEMRLWNNCAAADNDQSCCSCGVSSTCSSK